jgi:hypothetical protein
VTYADDAHGLVNGERQEQYGNPVDHMANVARAWSGVLGWTITPKQVALCLATLKLVREGNRSMPDNLRDAHGYLLIAERIDQAGWKTIHAVAATADTESA